MHFVYNNTRNLKAYTNNLKLQVSNGKTGLETNVYKNDDGHIYIFELFLQLYNIWFYFSSWFVKNINLSGDANVLLHVTFCLMNHDYTL